MDNFTKLDSWCSDFRADLSIGWLDVLFLNTWLFIFGMLLETTEEKMK